jgi:TP901 family phage tail tape measure protein
MTNLSTNWKIGVIVDSKAANAQIMSLSNAANAASASMGQMLSSPASPKAARSLVNVTKELDRMNSSIKKGTVHMNEMNRYRKDSNSLIRNSKQMQASYLMSQNRSNQSMIEGTRALKGLNRQAITATEKMAFMNTAFRSATTSAINMTKNLQWSGRQIMVGFGLPFGLMVAGVSKAFLDLEKQTVRFRKVFNDEINTISVDEAEEKVIRLANTMATTLGASRNEILDTAATFAQMGYAVEEIERLTKAATELGILGEINAGDSTKLLRSYSASGFKDTFVEAGGHIDDFEDHIKNMLNSIENSTGLTIEAMTKNMAQLIPLFSQYGLKSGEGASVLAGMSEALGGNTAEATTALKAIIQRFYDETKETKDQFASIGVDISKLQETYTNDLVGGLAALGKELDENPMLQDDNKAVSETFGNLFGIRQVSRAIGGIRAISKEYESGMDAVNDYGKGMKAISDPIESAAAAQRELTAITESMGGRLRQVKETILISASEIGADIIEMILPLAEMVASAVKWFSDLSQGTKQLAFRVGLVGLGIATFLTTVGVLGQAVLYLAKGVTYLFPQFELWTSKMVTSRIAVDNLDREMVEQGSTIQALLPQLTRIADANTNIASSANAAAAGMNRLNGAGGSMGATGIPISSSPAPSSNPGMRPSVGSQGISAGQWRPKPTPQTQWGDAYRSGDGMMGISTSLPPKPPAAKLITKKYVAATMAKARKAERAAAKREKFVRNRDARHKKWSMNKPNRRLDMFGPQVTNAGQQTGEGVQSQMYNASGGMGWRRGDKVTKSIRREFKDEAKRRRKEVYATPSTRRTLDERAARYSQRNVRRQESAVKWRGGLAGAGTVGMIAGAAVGGDKGNAMVKAGLGVHAFSFLANPKIMNGANNLSEKMLLSAKSGGKLAKVLKPATSRLVGMAGATGPMALAVAAIGASWFLISKHLKKVREEAAMSANEFRDMKAISEEFGMNIDSTPRTLGDGILSEDDLDEKSDAIKSLGKTLRNAQDFDDTNPGSDRVQSVFRNLSREWLAGGATIEEINEKLLEVGSEFNVTVTDVNADLLVSTLERDIMTAIDNAIQNFDFSDSSFWGGFNEGNKAELMNAAEATIQSIESGSRLSIAAAKLDFTGFGDDAKDATEEFVGYLEDSFGGDMDLEGLFNASDTMQVFLERIRQIDEGKGDDSFFTYTNKNAEKLSATLDKTNLNLLSTSTLAGISLGYVTDLLSIDSKRVQIMERMQSILEEIKSDNPNNAAIQLLTVDTLLADMTILDDVVGDTVMDVYNLSDALDSLTIARDATINLAVVYKPTDFATDAAKAAGDAYSDIEVMRHKNREGLAAPSVKTTAETDSKSYVSSLRSGLDGRRNDVIDSIMSMFDDATDAIIDKEEERQDARLDVLDDTHEATLESIEILKDAEIDAIDAKIKKIEDYLDTQKEVQGTLDSQIDMLEATVTGDYGRAAQIQNSLRFDLVDEAAKSAIEGLEEEKDSADELYEKKSDAEDEAQEQRVENMKLLHEQQIEGIENRRKAERVSVEASTVDLENMFLGSQASWAAFHSAATRAASGAGVTLTSEISSGFSHAIMDVKNQIQDDAMWEGLEFTAITNAINQAVSDADPITIDQKDIEGPITSGMDEAVKAWEKFLEHSNPTAQDEQRLLSGDGLGPNKATKAPVRLPSSFGGIESHHSGGFIGNGGAPRDVPAILQTGEYVMQRSAVDALGTDFLSGLNSYHTGGLAGLGQAYAANSLSNSGSKPMSRSMSPEDSGRDGWANNIPANIVKMFTSSLAQLSGGQYITSGWRSKEHNKRVGGASGSDHLTGKALDFVSKTDNSIANLDRMGAFFEKQAGVRWVGRPGNDKSGAHNDHVHVSYLHSGGKVGGAPKKPKFNVPSPAGASGATPNVMASSSTVLQFNIGNFNGTEENIDMLVRKVQSAIVNDNRRINPSRSFG